MSIIFPDYLLSTCIISSIYVFAGKTHLAGKLAEYVTLRGGKEPSNGSVATFNVDHKSSKELRQYLSSIADQCEGHSAADLPEVIILDNLHHVGSLAEVFNGFLSVKHHLW